MRHQDLRRLKELWDHLLRGGFPDLGKPHPKAGYRFAIGQARFEDGSVGVWRENLGHDKLVAQFRARAMVDVFASHLRDSGGVGLGDAAVSPPLVRRQARAAAWEKADEQMKYPSLVAERVNGELSADPYPYSPGFKLVAVRQAAPADAHPNGPQPSPSSSPRQAVRRTLHGEAERWLAWLRHRFSENDISDSYLDRAERSVKRLWELTADQPLDALAKPELDAIRLAFQSKRTKRGDLRDRDTIGTELGHVRALFQWMTDSEAWEPCRDWARRLRAVHRDDDNDDDADAETTVETYSMDELIRIYAAAPKSLKLWILCALNFAWGAKEIDTARARHFRTDSGERRVARFRHKRRPGAKPVPGRWIAWPETWALALARMATTPQDQSVNPKGLAFLTRDGQRLVRYQISETGKKRRYDACADALKETCTRIGVRNRGFYAFRRTAIDAIDERFGERIADLFCQHRPRSMTRKHYANKRWRKLFKALAWWRERLEPMFAAAAAAKRASSGETVEEASAG